MGLDMYLSANRYLGDWEPKLTATRAAVKEALDFDNGDQFVEVKADVLYWRKINSVHQWFVENVQGGTDDCRGYDVSREQLRELSALCKKVANNPDQAAYVLPTASGCFFGPTDYDDDYFDGVKYVARDIDDLLNDDRFAGWDFSYQSSW